VPGLAAVAYYIFLDPTAVIAKSDTKSVAIVVDHDFNHAGICVLVSVYDRLSANLMSSNFACRFLLIWRLMMKV